MKKNFFIIIISIIWAFQAFSQGYWTQKASLPTFGRQLGIAAYASNGLIYIGTGDAGGNGDNITDFWAYNPATNSWSQKASFIGSGRRMASCYSIGNNIYLGLGAIYGYSGTYTLLKDFYLYNISTNTWAQLADFPGTARRDATSFIMNGKGYICLGYNNSVFLSDIWEFNPTNNTWTQKATFPGTARGAAVSFVIGKKAYVGTGMSNSGYLTDFWEYDQDVDSWTQKASLPGVGRRFASGFAILNSGYIGTGWNGAADLKDYYEYKQNLNTWTQIPDLTGSIRDGSCGFTIGNKGYVFSGIDALTHTYLIDLWEYTPSGAGFDSYSNSSIDIIIYPTLINNWLNSECKNHEEKYQCVIFDIIGRTILKELFDFSKKQKISLNLSNLLPGKYYILFENSNRKVVKSFVKL